MALSPSQRAAIGLDDPTGFEAAQEFLPAPQRLPGAPNIEPNLKLTLAEGEQATAPKIRRLVNELLAGNLQNADVALRQLFSANPKAALELYIELSKFSLPQLKAVAVQVDERSEGSPRLMTFGQLQALLTQDAP